MLVRGPRVISCVPAARARESCSREIPVMGPQPTSPSGRATVMPDGTKCIPIEEAEAAKARQAKADEDRPNPAVEAYERIKCDLDELKEYGSYYLSAKLDGIK